MSYWRVVRRDETEGADYGSMHLNETPSLYLMPSLSSRCSAQALATEWLERNYEANRISLVEYRTRLQELRRAVRLGVDSASTCTDDSGQPCLFGILVTECVGQPDYSSEHLRTPLFELFRTANCRAHFQQLGTFTRNMKPSHPHSLFPWNPPCGIPYRDVGIEVLSVGIVSSLRQLMASGWLTDRWRLISVDCDHFASESWEQSFVCCYRNAQCVLSSLFRLPEFRKRLFGALSAMPSLWKLQALLESAWTLGFDPLGASQLASALRSANYQSGVPAMETSAASSVDGRNLVGLVDSTVWLGASDLVSLFGSIGVRCTLLECRAPSGPNNSHPRLLEHIYSYITTGRLSSTSLETFSAPMVLQHEGHSRIVIGIEVDDTEQPTALIALDPNTPVDAMRQITKAAECSRSPTASSGLSRLSPAPYNWMEILGSLRVDARDVTHPQYQLLQVNGLIETEMDLQDAMAPENITIAI